MGEPRASSARTQERTNPLAGFGATRTPRSAFGAVEVPADFRFSSLGVKAPKQGGGGLETSDLHARAMSARELDDHLLAPPALAEAIAAVHAGHPVRIVDDLRGHGELVV